MPPARVPYRCSTPKDRTPFHFEALLVDDRSQAEQLSHWSIGLLGRDFVPEHQALVPLRVDDAAHRRRSRNHLHMRGLEPEKKKNCSPKIREYFNEVDGSTYAQHFQPELHH